MNITLDILKTLCVGSEGRNAIVQQPWSLPGHFTTAVTNGRVALFLRQTVEGVQPADSGLSTRILSVVDVKGQQRSCDFGDLKAFVGDYLPPQPCDDCEGGKVECYACERPGANCLECGGTGFNSEDERQGELFGTYINLNGLAKFLQYLYSEQVVIHSPIAEDKPLYIDGSENGIAWRLVVTPMRLNNVKCPSFPEKAVA